MAINKIGVLGAGTMGAGIAQICVEAGYTVVLVDIADDFVARGVNGILKNWDKAAIPELAIEGPLLWRPDSRAQKSRTIQPRRRKRSASMSIENAGGSWRRSG